MASCRKQVLGSFRNCYARNLKIRRQLIRAVSALLITIPSMSGKCALAEQATPVKVADAVCARCHAGIVQSYLATPMANASGPASDSLRAAKFVHAGSSVEYVFAEQDRQPTLSYRSLKNPEIAGRFRLDYFLGSGHLGTTFLYSIGNFLFESPVAWYGPTAGYDMKPGLEAMHSMPPPLPMESNCLRCHMSSVQASDVGTINRYQGPPFLHTGITCEACHGESAAHVRTNGKSAIVNPMRLSAEKRDSVCISCHLEGDVLVERAGHSALDYRPGESISDFLAFYVRTRSNVMERGVSEVEQLSQSTCKRMSGDHMSCSSCHDPHYTPSQADKPAFFRTKCLACHTQPEFARTHHIENQDCTSCHMPRTGAENIPHVAWTDHRILRHPEAPNENSPADAAKGELSPIFSPGATPRDLAMANYKSLLEGDRSRESIAWEQLNALRSQFSADIPALDALGNMAAERGNREEAEQAFRQALTLAPEDLTALSNLGVLLAKEGKLSDSALKLQRAFARNQDLPGLAMNLARVQCISGDSEAAKSTLQATFAFGSNLESVRKLMVELNNCGAPAKR